jgi:segregation and condensation protein B
MESEEIQRRIESILFAAGEPVGAERISLAMGLTQETIHQEAKKLQDEYAFQRRGIRIVRLDQAYQMVSAPEQSDLITRALETRKPPKLSASALETLTVIAYYQPTTKAFVEQIRGVDSSYTISALLSKKLIEEQGRLTVPGRPILYGTTPDFLRTFGLSSLDDLPEVDLPSGRVSPEQLEMQLSIEENTP